MVKKQVSRSLACILTVILFSSLFAGVFAYGIGDPSDFPLLVIVDGKEYRFATHTGSATSGNWIELSGGTSIQLPYLSLTYNGIPGINYTKDKLVEIDTDTSFVGDSVIYPFTTHPVYAPGNTITYTLRGPVSLDGYPVEIRLINVTDPLAYESAASELYRGNRAAFEDLIKTANPNVQSLVTTKLNASGDYSSTLVAPTSGDYILLALDDAATMTLYSATLIEVLDGSLSATTPTQLTSGSYLNAQMALTGGATSTMVYGAVMIKQSAYSAVAQMTSSGSVSTTDVTVNGATIIDGSATGFSLFGGGLSGLSKSTLTSFLSQAFASSVYSVAFSSSTAATSTTLSVGTGNLAAGDYVVLLAVWDYTGDLTTGNRLIGLTQKTVKVNAPYFPLIIPVVPLPITQTEFNAQTTDQQVTTILTLSTTDAVALLEGTSTTKAAQVLEKLNATKAATVVDKMSTVKAVQIIGATQTEAAANILTKTSTQNATKIVVGLQNTKAAQIVEKMPTASVKSIVEEAVNTAKKTEMAGILNTANKETVGDVLLAVQPNAGAQIIREMATQDLNAAAERVEAAVKRQIQNLDPGQKQAYRQQLKATLEDPELTVDDLVNLFVEIANLPETPSVVAEIFEIIEASKTVQVVDGMVAGAKETEAALVFSYLSVEKLQEIYLALSTATRVALYPFFDVATIGNLPHLGEFTVTSLTASKATVAPSTAVTITAVVKNIGAETDSTTVTMSVNGVEAASDVITLDADESITLTWDVTKTAVGTYTVEVLGETVSFAVQAVPRPAAFTLSNLQVSPSLVEPGDDVTVTFTVRNTGEVSGTYSVEVKLDGAVVKTLSGSLNGGSSLALTAAVSSVEEGRHAVTVDGLSAEFNVELPPPGFPWTTAIGVLVVAVIAVAVYMYSKKQKEL